jgi:hypothetical protein
MTDEQEKRRRKCRKFEKKVFERGKAELFVVR